MQAQWRHEEEMPCSLYKNPEMVVSAKTFSYKNLWPEIILEKKERKIGVLENVANQVIEDNIHALTKASLPKEGLNKNLYQEI